MSNIGSLIENILVTGSSMQMQGHNQIAWMVWTGTAMCAVTIASSVGVGWGGYGAVWSDTAASE